MNTVPYRPEISNLLVKASANRSFRDRLLNNPTSVLTGMNLPREDYEVLAGIQAPTLKDFAIQVKMKLVTS